MEGPEIDEPFGIHSGGLDVDSPSGSRPGGTRLGGESDAGNSSLGESIDPALAEIVEEYTRRVQSGEDVDPEEYTRAYPDWADLLRIYLWTLRDLAHLPNVKTSRLSPALLSHAVVRPSRLGDFAIRCEVGRGGMGIVYEAEQISLGRRVALKVLPAAAAHDARALQRFQLEAQAAACLHHEHIVPVYAIGSHGDMPFYAMQFIEGASLAAVIATLRQLCGTEPSPSIEGPRDLSVALAVDLLSDRFGPGRDEATAGSPLDFRTAHYVRAVVRMTAQVAEALDYAHDQGIVHRDIKPANLILDHTGKVWVTDFGLAQIMGDATLTVTGDLPGTLRYMSPEQIMGRRALIDHRTDVYSLGVTLYELLSLEPAVEGQERWQIQAGIENNAPRLLRGLNPAIAPDLATIVAKAMARDGSARYPTAQDLGDDLNRLLAGRAVKARRSTAWERIVRWGRRNPIVAGLLTALVVVLFCGFAAVTVLSRRAEAEADRANRTARAEAEARAAEVRLRIHNHVEATSREFDRARELARQGNADQGLLWMAEALRQSPPERPDLARLARVNLDAWTGHIPRLRAILDHQAALYQAAFRPDGRAVLTGSADGTAQLWDSSDGHRIGLPIKHGDQVFPVGFSPDGRRIVTGGSDGKVRLWDAATGLPAGPTIIHGETLWETVFSPDGRFLMTSGQDRTLRLWNTNNGEPVGQPVGYGDLVDSDLSSDGRLLLSVAKDGAARLWDAATLQPTGMILRQGDRVTTARFSPDRQRIATGSEDGTARLWEAASGRPIGPVLHNKTACMRVMFSPDGQRIPDSGCRGFVANLGCDWATDLARHALRSRSLRVGILARWPAPGHRRSGPHGAALGCRDRPAVRLAPEASIARKVCVVLARWHARPDRQRRRHRQAVGGRHRRDRREGTKDGKSRGREKRHDPAAEAGRFVRRGGLQSRPGPGPRGQHAGWPGPPDRDGHRTADRPADVAPLVARPRPGVQPRRSSARDEQPRAAPTNP